MSAEEFSNLYDNIRNVPSEIASINQMNKPEIAKKLSAALIALKCAEKTIFKLSDAIVATNMELVKQCVSNRPTSVRPENTHTNQKELPVKQPPTIILKPKADPSNLDTDSIKTRYSDALKKVNVSNARMTDNGSILINVPNEDSYQKATTNLSSALASDFVFENPKKLLPKLKIVNVPKDLDDSVIVGSLCDKDDNLNNMVQDGEICEIVKSWDVKNRNDSSNVKKTVVLKCSPKIRNYIMTKNEGYVYFNCVRCKVFDRFFVSQCYHCQGFQHFANTCPEKNNPPTCGRCSLSHLTKDCSRNTEKCVNCVKMGSRKNINHCSFSNTCPQLIHEQNIIMRRTDFDGEKN